MDKFSYGMLINYCKEYDRCQKIMRGENITDSDKQYKQLKRILPLVKKRYENGEISKEKYEAYIKSLKDYERG